MNLINNLTPVIKYYPLPIKREHFIEGNLFPSSQILLPSDVVKSLVINYLLPKESSKMMEVNLSWHHLIKSDKNLYREKIFIPYCLLQAELFATQIKDPYHRAIALLNLAKIDPSNYVNKAKSVANELIPNFSNNHTKFVILFEITKFEAKHNLTEAIKTAQSIIDPGLRAKAFLEIAKLDPLHDLSPSLEAAQNIKNSSQKFEVLFAISKVEPSHNLTQTKLAALRITLLPMKNRAFTMIAIFEAQYNVKGARETLEMNSGANESKVLSAIAMIEAVTSIKLAIKTAKTIGNPIIRAETLLEIAKVDPQHNFKKVKEAAKEIHCPLQLFELLLETSKINPEYNLNELIKAAKNIKDYSDQVDALLKIAEIDPKHNLSNAIKSAKKIKDELSRFCFLKKIAKIDPQHDFSLAKQTAQILTDYKGYDQSKAFYDIVQLETQYDLIQAKQTAERINSHYFYTMALLDIAKVDPSHDFSQAIEMALKINNRTKSETLFEIVKNQLFFDITKAKITAYKIEDYVINSKAFLEIAKIEVLDDLIQAKATSQHLSPNADKDFSADFIELASLAKCNSLRLPKF